MIKIEGKRINASDIPTYHWYADLIYFDGPFLSLYKGEGNTDALYLWVDNDSSKNRWCVIPVERNILNKYLQKKISLKEVISKSDGVVFFNIFESTSGLRRSAFVEVLARDFPDEYLPHDKSILSDLIATPDAIKLSKEITENYMLGIDNELYTDDLSIIPNVFQQLYSFHYALDNLSMESVKDKVVSLMSSWTGGISAVNIFTGIKSIIPTIHRPQVTSIKYNSPGHIELNLLPHISKSIEIVMQRVLLERRFNRIESFYNGTYKYLKENNLSSFDEKGINLNNLITPDVKDKLLRRVNIFTELLGWSDYQYRFHSLNAHPLQQLRTILAYYRRLRTLREYVVQDNLSIGQSKIPGWH